MKRATPCTSDEQSPTHAGGSRRGMPPPPEHGQGYNKHFSQQRPSVPDARARRVRRIIVQPDGRDGVSNYSSPCSRQRSNLNWLPGEFFSSVGTSHGLEAQHCESRS